MAKMNLEPATRNTLMFIGGFVGSIYETLVEHVDRPYLLALFGGMMGLPWFISRDPEKSEDPPPGDKPKDDP